MRSRPGQPIRRCCGKARRLSRRNARIMFRWSASAQWMTSPTRPGSSPSRPRAMSRERCCRWTAAQIRGLGRQAIAKVTDVANYEQVQALMAEVMKTFGKIEILVSNAGIGGGGPLIELDKDVFERVLRVHLFGAFYCCQAAAR